MTDIEFDIVKLKQLADIDVHEAVKIFPSYEEYFGELYKFVEESKSYLQAYAPDRVVSSTAVCQSFQAEVKAIRGKLLSLGITGPGPMLLELLQEADSGDEKALTAWLTKFDFLIHSVAKQVAASLITQQNDKPVKPVILAVDDKPELLSAIVGMLSERFTVMAVTSGQAALKVVEKHQPELFLLDIEMPVMNGYDLTLKLRQNEKFAQTPIIFLTSKNTRGDVISAIQNGGNDYLLKPVSKELLLKKVLQYLGSI